MTSPSPTQARALHLLPHQGVAGRTRAVIEFVRHERMDGAMDELVLTERPLDVDRDFLAPATPVHFLGLQDASASARARRLADLAVGRGATILHAYSEADLRLAARAARLERSLVAFATPFDRPGPAGLLERRRRTRDLRSLSALHVPSPALEEPWAAAGRRPDQVTLASIDTQRFHPQNLESSWRKARLPDPEVLLVGTMMSATPGKRQDVLMEAVERRNALGRPTALMMVGDGPGFGDLKERVRGSDHLFARRRVLDAPGFFSKIDVFALHADDELVPLSLIEAMSCGRAALVADRGDVAQFVGADVALFTSPEDVDAVIAGLDRLADPEERKSFGELSRQRALERHGLGRLRRAVSDSYAASRSGTAMRTSR